MSEKNKEESKEKLEKAIKKLSRKTSVKMLRSEKSFDKKYKEVEKNIEDFTNTLLRDFKKKEDMSYRNIISYFNSNDSFEIYRNKLKKL